MKKKYYQAQFTKGKVTYMGTGSTEEDAMAAALAEYTKRTGKTADDKDRDTIKVARHRGPSPRKRGK